MSTYSYYLNSYKCWYILRSGCILLMFLCFCVTNKTSMQNFSNRQLLQYLPICAPGASLKARA